MTRGWLWVYTMIRLEPKTDSLATKRRPYHFNAKLNKNACVESSSLHAIPEVVCVEEAIELWIQVDDIDASLCGIPNNGTGKLASVVVLFCVDAQAAVDAEF